MKRVLAVITASVLVLALAGPVFADQPPGQLGYEGQPGNQGDGGGSNGGNGLLGYEGQPGNQGG